VRSRFPVGLYDSLPGISFLENSTASLIEIQDHEGVLREGRCSFGGDGSSVSDLLGTRRQSSPICSFDFQSPARNSSSLTH